MNALNLSPTAADEAVLLATLRAERATLATEISAGRGNGWQADIDRAQRGQAARQSHEDDVRAVLDGQSLTAPPAPVDLSEKRRRWSAVDAAVKRLEAARAQRELAALQVVADEATADLRSQVAAALALGQKYRQVAAALKPLIDRLTDAMHERSCLRAPDVERLPGLRHDADLEAVAGALLTAAEWIEAAQQAQKG